MSLEECLKQARGRAITSDTINGNFTKKDLDKKRLLGSILTFVGFIATMATLPLWGTTPSVISLVVWVGGIVIYRMGCDSWF